MLYPRSLSVSSLFLKLLILAGTAVIAAPLVGRTVVAAFRQDFRAEPPLTAGWQYSWNAPAGWAVGATGNLTTVSIGERGGLTPLSSNGDYWSADGDSISGNNEPAAHLRISSTGGHPGSTANNPDEQDRYVVLAYTVDTSGLYAIENSYVRLQSPLSNGIELLVFPGESEAIKQQYVTGTSNADFDMEIGYLGAGQTIYLAFGPSGDSSYDSFVCDFEVVLYARDSIEEQIEEAIQAGNQIINVAPGRYYSNAGGRHISLNGIVSTSGVEIIADGVLLVCQTANRAIEFINCDNLLIRGLTIDYDPPLFRQGTVVERDATSVDLQLHEGYPQTLSSTATSGIAYDSVSMDILANSTTIYPDSISELSAGLYRITSTQLGDAIETGDYLSFTEPTGIPHAVYLENCQYLSLHDMTIHGAPAFALLSRFGNSIEIDNVDVIPGPKPLRAFVPRLLSSNADGLHFKSSPGSITITDCELRHNGDDSIVLTAPYDPVISKPASDRLVLAPKTATDYAVGNFLKFSDPATGLTEIAEIVSATPLSTDRASIVAALLSYFPKAIVSASNFAKSYEVQLDRPILAGTGSLASMQGFVHTGFKIQNCSVENTRARGIKVAAVQGEISGNTIRNTLLAGIQFRPDAEFWLEGDFCEDVLIKGNLLSSCGIGSMNAEASINVGSRGFDNWLPGLGHNNLVFTGNEVTLAPGCNLLLRQTNNASVRSNRFIDSHQSLWDNQTWSRSVVWLEDVNDIRVEGLNRAERLDSSNADIGGQLGLGTNVSNLSNPALVFLDEDGDGITDDWEVLYTGNATAMSAYLDVDGDGMVNLEEFIANLNPLVKDRLRFGISKDGVLSWSPAPHRFFTVLEASSLDEEFSVLAADINGETSSYSVDTGKDGTSRLYLLQVHD